MILLNLDNVAKHYGPEPVLDGVACEVRPGERIGLVGPNGCGKTTLLKIIAGKEEADKGSIERHPSARLGYLEQHPEFAAGQTVWKIAESGLAELIALGHEAVQAAAQLSAAADDVEHRRLADRFDRLHHELEQRGGYHLDHQIQRVLEGLGLPLACFRQPARQLSGGQQSRLMLARLLLSEANVFLLDEPSNHLDLEATGWLETFLAELPPSKALIVVSHDRYFLDKVTNRTLELFRGTVDSYSGNFSAYWRQKAERLEVQRRTYEKQQEFIAKTEDFIRRNHYGLKHQQAKDREKKLERLERVEPPREISAPPMGFAHARRTGDVALRVEHLSKAYDRPLFTDLTFDVLRRQRWGVLGPNASGKTTLLRCVTGQVKPDQGNIIWGQGAHVGYLDQLTAGLDPELEVVEAVRPVGKEFTEPQRRNLLGRFGLSGDLVFQKVASLSGGERSRAGLARLAGEEPNVLILDEPTNHLDIWACDALERALQKFDGTVLLVSHDRYFLNRVVDHLLIVDNGRFRVIEGNYDTYLHFVEAGLAGPGFQPASPPPDEDAPITQNVRRSPRRRRSSASSDNGQAESGGETRRRRQFPYRKVGDLETEIAQTEAEIEAQKLSLAEPEVYRDGNRVRETMARIAELEDHLHRLIEHWDEAMELN
jgi:ATP-binding cassette subfamily F protein 3